MIKKLPSGRSRYEARGWANGRQFRRRFRTRKAAEQYMREIAMREERRRNGLPEEQEPITYRDLEAKFRLQHETQSKRWHEEMTGYSLERFGHVRVRDLRPDEIGAWLTGLTLSRQIKQHIRGAMRQVLERGVDWGYLARNPATTRLVRLPKQKPSDIRPFESWNQVEEIARATKKWNTLVVFACATGLRPEEWIALNWDDLDLKQRICRINKVVVDGELRSSSGKTDAAFRTIKLQ
jgi:integrase